MRTRWYLLICLLVAQIGCATSQQKLALPPVAATQARLVFYRGDNPYDGLIWARLSLNRQRIGVSAPGTVFYRDVAPGTYRIDVESEKLYPRQSKTVALEAGSTMFVKVIGLPYWGQSGIQWEGYTFTTAIVDPAVGQYEIGPLHLIAG